MASLHLVVITCIVAISLGPVPLTRGQDSDPLCDVEMDGSFDVGHYECADTADGSEKHTQAMADNTKRAEYTKCMQDLIGVKDDGKGGWSLDEVSVRKIYPALPNAELKSILGDCGNHEKAKAFAPKAIGPYECVMDSFGQLLKNKGCFS